MTTTTIPVPRSLDLANALEFSLACAKIGQADDLVFDFRGVTNVEPFGLLLVSSQIRVLVQRCGGCRYGVVNHEGMRYAAHMGFFQSFGIDFGNAPGEAKGSPRYLPLTVLECETLQRSAAQAGTEVGEEIEGRSKHLAHMLCGDDSGAVFDTLAYALRELMRNVVEHSQAAELLLCAQYWPSKQKVEVAIWDAGIGLRRSLANNPHLDASDDKRAINYALMPAVSGKAFKGARRRQRGPWANSGFGLYMTSRICRNGGTFFVASGDTGMLLTKTAGKRYYTCDHHGTAVRMVIRTDRISDLKEALEIYRTEGYAIQSKYKEIVSIDPSSASLMLSEDFDLSVWDKLLSKLKGAK